MISTSPTACVFRPIESRLYIADSGQPHHVRVFDVNPDDALTNSRVFCDGSRHGVPDVDALRLRRQPVVPARCDGIHVFNPAGERIGKILVPETPAKPVFRRAGMEMKSGSRPVIHYITSL